MCEILKEFEIKGLDGLTFKYEGKIRRAVDRKTKKIINTVTQGQNTYCRFRVDNPENPDDDDYLPAKQGIYLLVVMPELRPVLALYREGKTDGNCFKLTADAVTVKATLRADSNHNSGYNDNNATIYNRSNGLENLYLYIAEVTYRKREDGDSKAEEINAIAKGDGSLTIMGDKQHTGEPGTPNPPGPKRKPDPHEPGPAPVPNLPDFVDTPEANKYPRNLIYFGAPGTGKSHDLNDDKNGLLGCSDDKDKVDQYERVTFHPAYTYANFVGTYKPKMVKVKDSEEKTITYEYVAGPFLDVYVKAKNDPKKPYLLIIEEINRAEVAAVFGEVFQLLDRDMKDGGASTYSIQASDDEKEYLEGKGIKDSERIRIPGNMYIWATMNSADQGVKPMDTAFKRRWDFIYKSVDDEKTEAGIENLNVSLPGRDGKGKIVNWNMLRKAINKWMSVNNINEDKQLGPYFLSADVLKPMDDSTGEMNPEAFRKAFKSKIIMYLFEDAAKPKRSQLFSGCNQDKGRDSKDNDMSRRYSDICKMFDEIGVDIFNDKITGYTEGRGKDKNGIYVTVEAKPQVINQDDAAQGTPAEQTPEPTSPEEPAGTETENNAAVPSEPVDNDTPSEPEEGSAPSDDDGTDAQ